MALTNAQVTAITDSIAQGISDFNTNFVTGTSSARTSMNNGIGGTGGSATLGRVLGYAAVPDATDELLLLPKVNTVVSNVAAYLTGVAALNSFYLQYFPLLDALDTAQSGLNAFLTTNALQINAFSALAFNYYQQNAVSLGYRTSATVPVAIATGNFFPYAAVDTLWNITCSGATTFSTNAVGTNASSSVSGGGVGTLYIYKVNATNAAGGATLTITYTNSSGVSATVNYSTVSGTPTGSGSLAAGFSLGVAGSAITAVSGTGMTSAEQYSFGIKLVRSASY